MANELMMKFLPVSLSSLYITIQSGNTQYWNGTTFETTTAANWHNYAIATDADPHGVGDYLVTIPGGITINTIIILTAYRKVGGSAAAGDIQISDAATYLWTGTLLIPIVNASSFVGAPIGDGYQIPSSDITSTTFKLPTGDARRTKDNTGYHLVALDATYGYEIATSPAITASGTTGGTTGIQTFVGSWIPSQPTTTIAYILKEAVASGGTVSLGSVAPDNWLRTQSFQDGAITAAKLATDAISAAALSTAGVNKIQAGLATPTNITAGTIGNLTNLPPAPTDWLSASAVKSDAVTKLQAGLATPTNIVAGTITNLTNLPAPPTDWLSASAVRADAVTKIQVGGGSGGSGLPFATGTITGNATNSISFSSSAAITAGKWRGRRLYVYSGPNFSYMTDPCVTHTVSGSIHTMTFTNPQSTLSATGQIDLVSIVGG